MLHSKLISSPKLTNKLKRNWENCVRRTYPPVSTAKFVRNVGASKDYLPSPTKKPRAEHYYEELEAKTQPIKKVHKIAEWEGVPPPKPKRIRTRWKPNPQPETSTTNNVSSKPVEKVDTQEAVKETPVAKDADIETDNQIVAESHEDGVLNSVMANVLQDELHQIMVKVRQVLPDAPTTEVEDLVAYMFRNEAGDDLQNAMGLNVTARLLNVHNPLYAKLQFSGKPEPGCLQTFIRDYKITAFKRIADSNRDIFAARFDHMADFDALCVHSEVKCGSATVTIIPCYKYFTNPPSLKSIYADNIAKRNKQIAIDNTQTSSDKTEKNDEAVEVNTVNAKATNIKNINTATDKESVVKPSTTPTETTKANAKVLTNAGAVKDIASKNSKPATQTSSDKTEKTVEPVEVNTVNAKAAEIKNINTATEKQSVVKPSTTTPTETTKANPKVLTKTGAVKDIASKNPKPAVQEKSSTVVKETVKEAPAVIKKVTAKKVETVNKNNDISEKKQAQTDTIDEMMVVDEEIEEDDEEMTDQDILALMSGGIVLDECSGSEDD